MGDSEKCQLIRKIKEKKNRKKGSFAMSIVALEKKIEKK
jgi:hypothetical protein